MKPSFIEFGDCLPRVTATPTMMPAPNRNSGIPAATVGVSNAVQGINWYRYVAIYLGAYLSLGAQKPHTMAATVRVVEVATAPVMQHNVAPIISPISAPHMGILSGNTVSGPTNICSL
eukprot:COSAG02_NODE_5590_length_4207_cov_1.795034_3_plen_118_part_00